MPLSSLCRGLLSTLAHYSTTADAVLNLQKPARRFSDLTLYTAAAGSVLASQRVMLERLGPDVPALSPEQLRPVFQQQLRQVGVWLAKQPHVRTLFVDYDRVLAVPGAAAKAVAAFLDTALETATMAAAVDPALYRQSREARRLAAGG